MRTVHKRRCKNCQEAFETLDHRQRFCGRSCAATFNGKRRRPTEAQKAVTSEALRAYWRGRKHTDEYRENMRESVGRTTKGKHNKKPKNIYDCSNRTRMKVLRRLMLPCSRCGWSRCVCDLHHIRGKKVPDPHNHRNLSNLCPNCHREAHDGLIDPGELTTFEEQVGKRWLDHYFG